MTGFAVALAVASVMGPAGVLALLQSAVGGPSPATGHAEVIAQGVSALPTKSVAWRIGERSALPLAQAPVEAEPLGFVLALGDPILVDDATTNAQTRLAGGEALFVAGGGQQRAGVGAQSVKYMAISLVSSENAPNPGNVFPAPDGLRDIDLVRDVLAVNEKTAIAGTDAPILVLVTAGSIAVTTGAGGPTQTVGTGAAAVFKGDLTLTNTGKAGAVVVAGVIGPKVPPPTPRAAGSLTVRVYGCPAGVAVADLPAAGASEGNPCEPVDAGSAGVGLSLAGPSGKALTLADATVSADVLGSYAWSSLPYGAYTVVEAATPPDGYGDQVLVDGAGAVVKDGGVPLQAGAADVKVALYLLKATAGSVTARVFNCPPGMTAETLAAADCTAVTEGFDLALAGDGLASDLGLKDATLDGSAHVWSGLPLADGGATTLTVSETTLPVGFESSIVTGADTVGAGSGTVALSAANPAADVAFYNFQKSASVGTITVDTLICPAAGSAIKDCRRGESGPGGLGGVSIAGPDSGVVYSEANASQEGSSPYVWPRLAFGDYAMDTGALAAPAGFQIIGVEMTPDGADPSAGFTISANLPTANIIVLLAPSGGGSATPEAPSS